MNKNDFIATLLLLGFDDIGDCLVRKDDKLSAIYYVYSEVFHVITLSITRTPLELDLHPGHNEQYAKAINRYRLMYKQTHHE